MISIVLGHMDLPRIHKFVFMYHLPIFFLISGYFLSTKGNYFDFVKKKFRNIIVPYYFICIAICLLSIPISFFMHQGIIENLIHWIIASLYGSGAANVDPFGIPTIGAIWFLWATFWGEILLRRFVDFKNQILLALGVVITFIICFYTTRFIWLPLSIQTTGSAIIYMYFGYQIRLNREYIQKHSGKVIKVIFFVLSCIGSMVFYKNYSSFALVHNEIGHWYFIPLSLCACYVLVVVSRFISKHSLILRRYFSFLGKYSLLMLGFHIIELDLCPWYAIFLKLSPSLVTNPVLFPLVLAFCKIFGISVCIYVALHLSLIRTIFHYDEV